MLKIFGESAKKLAGKHTFSGLIGMFAILHFYYGVPVHGWSETGIGFAAVIAIVFVGSLIAHQASHDFLAIGGFTFAALALDFFYREQVVGQPTASLVFEWLGNGPATVNFSSFGLASIWFFSQIDTGH